MIYFLSDIHGGESADGLYDYLSFCTDDDLLIILGDLGLDFEDTAACREFTGYFKSINKKIAVVDGNHENFGFINSLPMGDMYGGKVRFLNDNIVFLMRGNIYSIKGHTFFVMGGCESSKKWRDAGLWSPLEKPNGEEIERAYKNLSQHNNRVDYVLTHKYRNPENTADPMTLDGLIEYIDENVDFGHWYSGHWHEELKIDDRHTVVYDKLKKLV